MRTRNGAIIAISAAAAPRRRAAFRHAILGGRSTTTSADGKSTDATLENFPVSVSRDPVLTLKPPFHGGTWLAGDGAANTTNHRRSIFAIDGHLYSPERFAIDWLKVGPNGDSRHDGSSRNDNWWGWGEPVLAVADGEITEVVDDWPASGSVPDFDRRIAEPFRDFTRKNIRTLWILRRAVKPWDPADVDNGVATLSLDANTGLLKELDSASVLPADSKLTPGMPSEVLIATGERTALEYFIKPLADAMRHAFREQ